MGDLTTTIWINGTEFDEGTTTGDPSSTVGSVSFGAGFAPAASHFDIKNVTVGTTGRGSSDLFAPALDDLSEFDGLVGNDGSIVAAGGVLSVDSSSGDHFGYKGFTGVTDIWIKFDLQKRTGDAGADYFDAWIDNTDAAADTTNIFGIYDGVGQWTWYDQIGGGSFGSGPPGGSYVTVEIYLSYTGGGGGTPTNTTQDTAINLAPFCAEATVTNAGAPDTPADEDPLNTVYELGGTFSRQVWWKLTNTSGAQAYARFTITNTSGSNIDLAGAIYLDDPAATQLLSARISGSDVSSWWFPPLTASSSFTLGVALEAGQTVWIELAGDDTEGDGDGWNGALQLEWQLLAATFYDTPDSFEGGTEFVSGFTDGISDGPEPVSYCKMGDLHFAALDEGSDTEFLVAVWTTGGGSPTIYTIALDMPTPSSPTVPVPVCSEYITNSTAKPYGPAAPQLRTDGTNVWLVAYGENDNTETCGTPPTAKAAPQWAPTVFVWGGSGFLYIGVMSPETFPWSGGYLQQIGMISAAASTEEVGVLHVMWSESGVAEIDDVTCAIDSFGSFVHYAQFSTTGLVASGDTLTSGAPASSPSSLVPYTSSYLFVTNAYGSPIAFYGYPATLGLTTGSQPGNITYSDLIEMWAVDESDGSITVLQSAHGSTLLGGTTTLDETHFDVTVGGTRQQPQDTFGGVDTFFFAFPWGSGPTWDLLNVPADGSSAIVVTTPAAHPANAEDVYDDSRNIWLGGGYIDGVSLTCSGGTSSLDTTAENINLDSGDAARLELFYDAGEDAFYTLGFKIESPAYQIAPVKVPILRDYLICTVGDCAVSAGIHIWQRI